MRVLDTTTILAAMAQVAQRPRPTRIVVRRVPSDGLLVVPQGAIPVMLMSSTPRPRPRSVRAGDSCA